MTKLEKLIAELCPNGVEFRKLGEVVEKVKSKGVSAKKLKELAVAEGGDVRLLSTGNFEGFSTEEKADDFLETGEVITIPTGGSASLKYHNGKFVNSLNHILTSKTENVRFIYHFMLSKKRFNRKLLSREWRETSRDEKHFRNQNPHPAA